MRPCQVREMSDAEAAWVGAIIDAEGWVLIQPIYKVNAVRISVGNTEPEIISGLLRATGVGTVCHHKRSKPHHLPMFQWTANAWNDVMAIAKRCAPYSMKAQKVLAQSRRIT